MAWLGLDIGGANLKAADGRGWAASRAFPLWQRPQELAPALAELLSAAPPVAALAVTMTGELADCYASKSEGVRAILAAVAAVAGQRPIRVYRVDGGWADLARACDQPLAVAAANWHALARFAARFAPVHGALLIDIGSTTCDLIPVAEGRPVALGTTDPERLVEGELVYTGVDRSPVCAIVRHLPWRGRSCPVAQELFATAADAYLLLGDIAEDARSSRGSADGRSWTRADAGSRLARAICADREMVDPASLQEMARAIAESQLQMIAESAGRVLGRLPGGAAAILSGAGEFLAARVARRLGLSVAASLSERLGRDVSRAAAAHAVAALAMEDGLP